MATVSRVVRHPGAPLVGIVVIVAVIATWSWSRGSGPADAMQPLRVRATSVYDFASLDEMTAASDLVVEADVVAVERGRLVGEPDEGGVISRIVTLAVADVIHTNPTAASTLARTLIVEEEGWLPDGTPIIVDDVEPSSVGDHGVWFLDAITVLDGGEVPVYLVINSQGRMLERGGRVMGGDQTDPLVLAIQQHSFDELIRTLQSTSQRGFRTHPNVVLVGP